MKYQRDYTCITDDQVAARIKDIHTAALVSRTRVTEEFITIYVESERELNVTIPEDTRRMYQAQQGLLERSHYVKLTKCVASKMFLEQEYHKENKWLLDKRIVEKIRRFPCDEDFHFYGDK